ncbi:MAG: glycosyltransferase family 4 protein [bacterium]
MMSARKFRILILTPGLDGGGCERMTRSLAKGLAGEFDVSLMCLYEQPQELLRFCSNEGYNLLPPLGKRVGRGLLAVVANLRSLLKEERFDLVHSNNLLVDMVLRLATIGRPMPVVKTLHDPLPWNWSWDHKKIVGRVLETIPLQRRFHFVAISRTVAQFWADFLHWHLDRIFVIYNGIEVAYLQPPAGTQRDYNSIVSVGRLVPERAFGVLLEAVALLASGTVSMLRIVGDGIERAKLESKSLALGIKSIVNFPGWLSDARPALWSSGIYVDTYPWEGFGLALLEAMAAGCAVIVPHGTGAQELVEDGVSGIVVPPCDPHALADVLTDLLRNPGKVKAMGAHAIERARQFDLSKMVKGYANLYRQILSGAS